MTDAIPLARRDAIAGRLALGQPVQAAALAAEFHVSEDAIRRDLRALAAEGRCRRVYGGALPVTAASAPMAARIDAARERKAALARTAASLIGRGELLLLDSGSTPLALVEYLPEDAELTVATNSIDIAAAVLRRADLNLIMIGGAVDPTAGGCVDAGAVQSVARMNVDLAFIGACALSPRRGLSAFGLADATFKRAVVAASARCVVLATTDKLAARAPHRFATLNEIDCIVVEHDLPPEDRAALSNAGASVLTAEPPAQP
ncbi:DeoR/GlpR family DNA-binding transcription regulator [Burkholderia thailandensis]|uniref:DeoR/GlpR family DNA-binding transcription regulator n=3 Tax=Burkholderia thailandensis TaxID=57975 RepID=UPI0003EC80D1|nr:DeoR/GlpR family DNA-binding transcription regulator [Burkholderia thailandensis]AHI68354.1 deoR-like helix-turn-helix domain protein [Burkholderia thailandensis H0587]AIP65193.1 DeoR faimly transcriptional regulator [Burkholderia thailandensis]AJY32349.1 deoR-like helix-turn-helix domain protein [Burkholderia thailandensis 34]AOI54853.1 DeoR family transcriptional regulator [Burkholderia thailandensis]AOJ53713.1 DeoR family transcriptional regulator [Burkholderia thailandensis]